MVVGTSFVDGLIYGEALLGRCLRTYLWTTASLRMGTRTALGPHISTGLRNTYSSTTQGWACY